MTIEDAAFLLVGIALGYYVMRNMVTTRRPI